MTPAEKNEHYGMLNERFEVRSAKLRSIGFKYQHVPMMGLAVFVKERHGRSMSIAAGSVMNADEIVWADALERAERF